MERVQACESSGLAGENKVDVMVAPEFAPIGQSVGAAGISPMPNPAQACVNVPIQYARWRVPYHTSAFGSASLPLLHAEGLQST